MSLPKAICLQTKSGMEGSGWFGQELAEAIAGNGVRVFYVAPPAVPAEREPSSPNIERFVVPREETTGVSKPYRVYTSLRRVWFGVVGCVRARASTRDFLFSIPDPLVFFLPLQILLRILGGRVHLVIHDALPHAWTLPKPFRFIQKLSLWASYRLATRLLPTTRAGQEILLREFGIAPSRIVIVPHGAYIFDHITQPPGSRSLLVFGTLRRNKGVLEAIKAVQLCRERGSTVVLKIAGNPDKLEPEYWETCLAQIALAPEGISTEIGFVPDERVPLLIAESDAVLLPYNNFNSQSGVAMVVVSGARPVIASATGGLAELFELGMAGLSMSSAPMAGEIAEAIEEFFLQSSSHWHDAALAAREQINERLNWHSVGAQYISAMIPDHFPPEQGKTN